ncbi:MAG: hypothetical protein KatS3mg104_3236 [Phycisphaerae bacterium]|nr:MAG: hypothetical protein KatS3mg104_3236 [Phycisphaerae bacterium]
MKPSLLRRKKERGQSTVEYILLVTAVIAVAIVFLRPNGEGVLYNTVNKTFHDAASEVNTLSDRLKASHPAG